MESGNDDFVWDIEISVNSSGEIYLPQKENIKKVIVNGSEIPVSDLTIEDGHPNFWTLGKLESGKHHIEVH